MRIDLNAKVRTRDGEDAGKIRYAIFDPDVNDLSHFVVSTGGLFGNDVVVPAGSVVPPEIAEDTTREERVVMLNLSKSELEGMPPFDPQRYGEPPAGWASPTAYGYPASSFLWPTDEAGALARFGIEVDPAAPVDSEGTTVAKGAAVFDRDGDNVGVVEELRYDTVKSDMGGIVLRFGGTFQRLFGGGETVEVSKDAITGIDADGVHLSLDKSELEKMALPGDKAA